MEINTPARGQEGQETREEREMYKYPPHRTTQATRPVDNVEESRRLYGSSTTEVIGRRSSRRSIPKDRYSVVFKLPEAPKSKRGAKSSMAPSLKTLKAVLKESWAQRPEPTAPLRRRSKSRKSSGSTRTRAASLERMQTGSIKNSSSARNSIKTRYKVADGSSYV